MTREEAIKFLSNTKVYVKDKSEEIQKKLFDIGFKWDNEPSQTIAYTDKPFLFIYELSGITYSSNVNWFYNHTNKEVTPEDILGITIEPKYRPFNDATECWQEMLKHEPFGWIKYKEKNCRVAISIIEDIKCDLKGYKSSFEEYTFADGTPFGIKED